MNEALREFDIERLVEAYDEIEPDPANQQQRVKFGTSGHRGSSLKGTFNRMHVEAVCQAICDFRRSRGISGPLFLGRDTHALSERAYETAVEVFSGNGVQVVLQEPDEPVATPVISRAIIRWNASGRAVADGVVVTPSHNPPDDGGIKYNPPNGGPAPSETTSEIERLANEYLEKNNDGVKRKRPAAANEVTRADLNGAYVAELERVIDVELLKQSRVRIGVDPLGGTALWLWKRIGSDLGLDVHIIDESVDPSFSFIPPDRHGVVRADCSAPHVVERLVANMGRFDIGCANDPDADRHAVVCRSSGLMDANSYLVACCHYLFTQRPRWSPSARIGKTAVTTGLLDRLGRVLNRQVYETPVGFKWFAEGLYEAWLGFAGEESAGASMLSRDGSCWTTDKDGVAACLVGAEMIARLGKDPAEVLEALKDDIGSSCSKREDLPMGARGREGLPILLSKLKETKELAGEEVLSATDRASGNSQSIGGVKLTTRKGWVAVRPSGTEPVCKIYVESLEGEWWLKSAAKQVVEMALREIG